MIRALEKIIFAGLFSIVAAKASAEPSSFKCGSKSTANICRVELKPGIAFDFVNGETQQWDSSKITKIANYLRQVAELPSESFLKTIMRAGLNRVFLLETEAESGWAWFDPKMGGIIIGNRFLEESEKYHVAGEPPAGKVTITHELVHAFDQSYRNTHGQLFSETQEFLNTVGYVKSGDHWEVRGVSYADYFKDWDEMRIASRSNDSTVVQHAFELNRMGGMKYGFPTLYSMKNPQEGLAEMAAYALLDEKVGSYLNAKVLSLIQRVIFQ